MDSSELARMRIRIERSTKRMGFAKLVEHEDVQQEIICRMLQGHHAHATIDQAVIDYIRHEFGRTGAVHTNPQLIRQEDLNHQPPAYTSEWLPSWEMKQDCIRICKDLNPRQRKIVQLYFIEGHTLVEIARKFKVSEGRISQLLKEICLKLGRHDKIKDS